MREFSYHLESAQGYIELEMFAEAANELESIDPASWALSDVAEFRVIIYKALEKWDLAEEAARHLVKVSPEESCWWIQWAYAARRCQSIEAARRILLDAEKLHPYDAQLQFNLGCYACKMGDTEEAKTRVKVAILLEGKYRVMALYEQDLEPLWDEIAKALERDDALAGEK